jgi:chemotaxis protein histidine kinase CheA
LFVFDVSHFCVDMSESVGTNERGEGQIMVSKSLVTVKDKPSEPELEGNIRTLVWDSASAQKAVEGEDDQASPAELTASVRELSRVSIDQVDHLITELQTLRRTLKTTGERIERDIAEYATLSSQASQVTKIVLDGVKQLPM